MHCTVIQCNALKYNATQHNVSTTQSDAIRRLCSENEFQSSIQQIQNTIQYNRTDMEKVQKCPQADFLEMKMSTLFQKFPHSTRGFPIP